MCHIRTAACLLCVALAHGGCGGQTGEPLLVPPKPAVASQIGTSPANNPPSPRDSASDDAKTQTKLPADKLAAAPFQPPYAQRRDPFSRPDVTKAPATTRDEQLATRDVVLKGFANAGIVRALLAIDGKIAAVAEGDRHTDIQIVAITPPRVILQRGRVRWTESLYESP